MDIAELESIYRDIIIKLTETVDALFLENLQYKQIDELESSKSFRLINRSAELIKDLNSRKRGSK
jgi:hypothetical protein